jgi:hypothetical protein
LGTRDSGWVRGIRVGFAGRGSGALGWRTRWAWEWGSWELFFLGTSRSSQRRSSAAIGAVRAFPFRGNLTSALFVGGFPFCRMRGRESLLEAKALRHGSSGKTSGSFARSGDGESGVRFCPVTALSCLFPGWLRSTRRLRSLPRKTATHSNAVPDPLPLSRPCVRGPMVPPELLRSARELPPPAPLSSRPSRTTTRSPDSFRLKQDLALNISKFTGAAPRSRLAWGQGGGATVGGIRWRLLGRIPGACPGRGGRAGGGVRVRRWRGFRCGGFAFSSVLGRRVSDPRGGKGFAERRGPDPMKLARGSWIALLPRKGAGFSRLTRPAPGIGRALAVFVSPLPAFDAFPTTVQASDLPRLRSRPFSHQQPCGAKERRMCKIRVRGREGRQESEGD